jgi:integrase
MRIEPKKRVRWITREEAERLVDSLPSHLKPAVEFSHATGSRQDNVLDLQWSQIDLKRRHTWIHADQAKGKRDIAVPLNASAMNVLKRRMAKHSKHVFTTGATRLRESIMTHGSEPARKQVWTISAGTTCGIPGAGTLGLAQAYKR